MRIGADVGGTFTDVLVLDADGRVRFTKVLSTPPDYDRAVIDAAAQLGGGEAVEAVVHGTTVATNAVLERRGARTALVTTEGFRDVLELRRMRMPHLYDYFWTKPTSLVPAPPAPRGRRADHRVGRGAEAARRGRRARRRGAAARARARGGRRLPAPRARPPASTSGGSARSCARSCPACRCRSRARSCASSRSTSAPRRPSSTRTCGR